jgi:hypothetical protein
VKSDSRAASAGCAPSFDPGLDMQFPDNQMDFHYGHGIFGPKPKYRSLDSIRLVCATQAALVPIPCTRSRWMWGAHKISLS